MDQLLPHEIVLSKPMAVSFSETTITRNGLTQGLVYYNPNSMMVSNSSMTISREVQGVWYDTVQLKSGHKLLLCKLEPICALLSRPLWYDVMVHVEWKNGYPAQCTCAGPIRK